MMDSQFRYGNFESAIFLECLMNQCNVECGNFSQSNFSNCIFNNVNCDGADFSSARLDAIIIDANTQMTNILCTNAVLTGNRWMGHAFEAATFENATMSNCVFDSSKMGEVNFSHATMEYVQFHATIFSLTANFSETVLTHVSIQDADCGHVSFYKSQWDKCSIKRSSFTHGNFTQMTILDSTMEFCVFTNTSFTNATLTRCSFKNTNLERANFSEAILDTINTDAVFNYSQFNKAKLVNFTLDHASMAHCNLNNAKLERLKCIAMDWTESTFHHSNFDDVTIDDKSVLGGASFIDSNMDNVTFNGTTLDNVVFDQGKLFIMSFVEASLNGTSFVGSILSDVDFTYAFLSADSNEGPSEEAKVAAKFEEATLTRVKFLDSYLRFTIFSESTLSLCTFRGTSSSYDKMNLSEANFDGVILTDTTFVNCDLANATFANSTLIRCHFVKCAMSYLDIENVQLEYCTADVPTVLPPSWMRDSHGWIVWQDPGFSDEEQKHKIMALGAFGESFRIIQSFDQMNLDGMFVVTWNDGSTTDATRIHHMSKIQPNAYKLGDAVFVCIEYDEEYGDNHYLHGLIKYTYANGTYDIEYYKTSATVQYKTANMNQNHIDIFPEYFEHGEQGTVDIFDDRYYRSVKEINDTTMWYNEEYIDTVNSLQISFKQPTSVKIDDFVFVLIKSNVLAEYDNHYLAGVVAKDNGNNTYEITYSTFQSANAPTTQHIEFLHLPATIQR